jgi:hypothetical protein
MTFGLHYFCGVLSPSQRFCYVLYSTGRMYCPYSCIFIFRHLVQNKVLVILSRGRLLLYSRVVSTTLYERLGPNLSVDADAHVEYNISRAALRKVLPVVTPLLVLVTWYKY